MNAAELEHRAKDLIEEVDDHKLRAWAAIVVELCGVCARLEEKLDQAINQAKRKA